MPWGHCKACGGTHALSDDGLCFSCETALVHLEWEQDKKARPMISISDLVQRYAERINWKKWEAEGISLSELACAVMGFHFLQTMPYDKYLKTDHWACTRKEALEYYHHTCQQCGDKTGLHVHHLSYVNRGLETMDDLVVLCNFCHKKIHHKEIPA